MNPVVELTLNIMRGWIGRGEQGGNNDGWFVRFLTKGRRGAWCAALISTALETACIALRQPVPIPYTRGARRLYRHWSGAGRRVEVTELQPGDLVLWSRGRLRWQGHVALVSACTDTPGVVRLIDGNIGKRAKVREYEKDLRNDPKLLGCARL